MSQSSRGSGNRNSRHVPNQHGRTHGSKRPLNLSHNAYGRECRQLFTTVDEMETTYNNFSKQPTSIPNAQENLFIADTTNDLGEIHPVSPPLSYQMRSPQPSGSGMGMRNSPLHIHNNFQNPPEINSYSALPINFASLRTDVRVSPLHFQNSPAFFHSTPRESWQENEGSSCKKPRMAHHVDNLTSCWEQHRSPRQTITPHRTNSFSKKLRYTPARICNRTDPYRRLHSPPHYLPTNRRTLHPSSPPPLQTTFMSQVPIVYTPPFTVHPQTGLQLPAPLPSMFANPPDSFPLFPGYTNYVPAHQRALSPHHVTTFPANFNDSPPLSPVNFSSRSSDNSSPNHHTAHQMDSIPRGNIVRSNGRFRYHPFQSNSQFSNLFHILAMFPMSPPEIVSPESDLENYEALLNVAARLSETHPRGLNRIQINQIPSFKFETNRHRGDQTSCVVCMCDFEDRQTLRHLPCSHKFHAKCVDKWLKTNSTCPICRGNATTGPL